MAKHLANKSGILAFDFINTIVDVKKVATKEQLDDYADHLRRYNYHKVWKALHLPSSWASAPIFDDVIPGLNKLRQLGYALVAFTNAPAALTIQWISDNNLPFQDIFPLESLKVFKPNLEAYVLLRDYYRLPASKTTVTTANRNFGDIEGAYKVGMDAYYINRAGDEDSKSPSTLVELADNLEALQ